MAMHIVNKTKDKVISLPAKEVTYKQLKPLTSELAHKILLELAKSPSYPIALAKKLGVHEQKVYYHIRNLEKARIVQVVKTDSVHGAAANFYGLVEPAFVIAYKEFQEALKLEEPVSYSLLEPFIENGQLNAAIIVGSPDPHGPEKARSRDGYYGIDFALFLGSFLNTIQGLNVKLDTEARTEDLQKNIILIGGPVVNSVTASLNMKMPIRFNKENNWSIYSTVSNKEYHSDEAGIIVKMKNPFNKKKFALIIAGKRHSGTRAVMIAFIKHFKEIAKGNKFNDKVFAKIIEGIDLDSDGIVDEIEIVE
ncbi:S-layer protein [Candidatus Woesearchaeota archaeon]|nr:S-layer protein [Candidatus Woesearchaeota archaeon]